LAPFALGLGLATPFAVLGGPVGSLTSFSNGTVADADQVNANFTELGTQIDDNDSRIGTNASDIATNATDIATNAAAISIANDRIHLAAQQDSTVSCLTAGQTTNLPGASLTFTLAEERTLRLDLSGAVDIGNPNSGQQGCGTHWGAGFEVDGVRQGATEWGEAINAGQYGASSWWFDYDATRIITLAAGTHTVNGWVYNWNGSSCTCLGLNASQFAAGKLTIEDWD
jgi:hypothetical protein